MPHSVSPPEFSPDTVNKLPSANHSLRTLNNQTPNLTSPFIPRLHNRTLYLLTLLYCFHRSQNLTVVGWMCLCTKSLQLWTLCDPINCDLPGSSVHGILQARILEWVAISSSRASFPTKDRTHVIYASYIGRQVFFFFFFFLSLIHLGSPRRSR